MDLAEQFDPIPASLTLLSIHQGTKCPVHLGSQGDLDVVVAEAIEWGSHVITVTVAGVPARRALDALGGARAARAARRGTFGRSATHRACRVPPLLAPCRISRPAAPEGGVRCECSCSA
jgi:hypothetical protein